MRTIAGHADQSDGRLLVVDDDQVQRTIIAKIGARLGYDARNGRAMDILLGPRIKGVGAAIDDLGTGFSSLTALASSALLPLPHR